MNLLRARVKKCVTVFGKERLSSFCILVCKFECSIHNFGGPFQAVMDEQCIELNRWRGGTPQSIILSHGFTFHHLVNPHTHIHTCTWSARNISGCEKEASWAMITATDCCLPSVDLCRRVRGLNIIPACWGRSTEQGVRQRAKARLRGKKSQPSLKWIMPLYRITACLTSCISVKERRFSLYKHVFFPNAVLFFNHIQ